MEKKCCFNCSHCFYLKKEKYDCYDVMLFLCEEKNEVMDEWYADCKICKNFSYNDGYIEDYFQNKKIFNI